MPQLSSLSVSGYRSIKRLDDFPLTSLNVLTGANGVGKSSFLGFFGMLAALERGALQSFVRAQGGADAVFFSGRERASLIRAGLDFGDIGYQFKLVPTDDNGVIFKSEHSLLLDVYSSVQPRLLLSADHAESHLRDASDNYSPTVRRALSQFRLYRFGDLGALSGFSRLIDEEERIVLEEDASNLGSVLFALAGRHDREYGKIVDMVRSHVPFFGDFALREDGSGSVIFEWFRSGDFSTPRGPEMLSFGVLRFICLVTLLFLPEKMQAPTLLIDEPELGLHPRVVRDLGVLLRQVSRSTQLIVSTLSEDLVAGLDPAQVIAVDLVDGVSSFERR